MSKKMRDNLRVGLIAVAAVIVVQVVMFATLSCIPNTALTRQMFPSLLGFRNEIREAVSIGTSALWGQFDIFHTNPSKNTDLKVFSIKVGPKNFRKVLKPIEKWVAAGGKTPEKTQWSRAKFYYNGHEWKVKIKLAGKRLEHWTEARKSYAVKFPKDDLFYGQRMLRLYPPYNKGGIVTGQLLFWMASEVGLIAPKSEYIVLNFNGVDQGVFFAVEENRKEMLAWNNRPDGAPIYDLEKETFHRFGHTIVDDGMRRKNNFTSLIQSDAIIADIANQKVAEMLSRAFYPQAQGEAAALVDYLDTAKFAAFEAIRSVFQDVHGEIGSSRLYFNPSTGKIEPVIWDAYIPRQWYSDSPYASVTSERFPLNAPYEFNTFLRDPDIHLEYLRTLYKLSTQIDVLAKYDEIYSDVRQAYLSTPVRKLEIKIGALTRREIEHPRIFLETNRRIIQAILEGRRLDQGVFVLLASNVLQRQIAMDLEIFSISDLRLDGLTVPMTCGTASGSPVRLYIDSNHNHQFDADDAMVREAPCQKDAVTFAAIHHRYSTARDDGYEPVVRNESYFIRWDDPAIAVDQEDVRQLAFEIQNLVTQQPYAEDILVKSIHDLPRPMVVNRDDSLATFVKQHARLLMIDGERLVFRPGRHVLRETIIFPLQTAVTMPAGTQLTLMPDVSMLVRGHLTIAGTVQRPVTIGAAIPGKHFGTFAVLGHDVDARYVSIHDGGEAYIGGVHFIGQMSVYHGNLTLDHATVGRSTSDDGLNVKYGHVVITNNTFHLNAFDALDLDYCTGEVVNNVFTNGNTPDGDGLDLSGSTLLVKGNTISQFGDKGISAGERSELTLFDNVVHSNTIGIAIKDLSKVTVYSTTIARNVTGVSLYRKKPTFGGGTGTIVNSILSNTQDVVADRLSALEARNSTSSNETQYGFTTSQPTFVASSANGRLELDTNNDPLLLQGAVIDDLQLFVTTHGRRYPLGAISTR